MTLLLVALGGAVGAALRFVVAHHLDSRVPWGTLLVNVAGSFLLGLWSGLALGENAMALLGVGFCGAFTTYSAFAVQTHARGWAGGSAYAGATIVLALVACVGGFVVGQA